MSSKAHPIFLLLSLLICSPAAGSAIIASTDFDGRSFISPNTAGNLNWVVNGIADPGDISVIRTDNNNPVGLFGANALVQNIFAPALNTGNENTSWITEIPLTPLPGSIVPVREVRFDFWAINAGQVQNVDRWSDFVVTLLDPSSNVLESVSIENVVNGTGVSPGAGTPVSLPFNTDLTGPGSYTLRIEGGNIFANYTGNHTAIDNLAIITPEPGTGALLLLGILGILRRRR